LRVLVLTTSYPTPEAPVAGIFVREHVEAARPHCDPTVVHLERSDAVRRVEVERFDEGWRVRYPHRPATLWHLRAARRGLALVGDADLVHAHFFLAGLPAVLFQRRPVVVSEHWSIFLPEDPARLSPAARLGAKLAFERAAVVLPVSAALGRAIAALAPRARLEVVPNAVDTGLFHPAPERPRGERLRLLTVGLIYEAKAHDVMLRGVAELRRRGVDADLDIVGDGPLRAAAEGLARELGLDDRVTFHGVLSKPEIAERMRAADLFVLSSRYENNPCAVIESLASGLPVVATSVGGVPELVDDTAGALVRPEDPAALADGVLRASQALDGYDRPVIARRAAERFGAPHVGGALAAAYGDALARRGR
jgi:glycosyltransferase involved in cell wall biosynthesis